MRELGLKAALLAAGLVVAGCASGPTDSTGIDLLASKNYAAAEAYYANEVAENPEDAYAWLNLGAANEAQGNFSDAARAYQMAVEKGEGEPINQTVYNGQVKNEDTTVAAVAAYNLSNLPQ